MTKKIKIDLSRVDLILISFLREREKDEKEKSSLMPCDNDWDYEKLFSSQKLRLQGE
jgi:hypothetical protein